MKPTPLLSFALFLALALSGSLAISTANGAPRAASPPLDTRVLIEEVDGDWKVVCLRIMRTGKIDTYIIDHNTAITVNNHPGTLADIKVGMQVRCFIERDAHTLDILSAGEADTK